MVEVKSLGKSTSRPSVYVCVCSSIMTSRVHTRGSTSIIPGSRIKQGKLHRWQIPWLICVWLCVRQYVMSSLFPRKNLGCIGDEMVICRKNNVCQLGFENCRSKCKLAMKKLWLTNANKSSVIHWWCISIMIYYRMCSFQIMYNYILCNENLKRILYNPLMPKRYFCTSI